ncbi:DNA polymerase III subunit gamma/tau [Legionella massiliensis]|uniref:DNA polymerase III subunit delta' n=1 Tax=Legionella massiliensis TaxID=1034943 RepID=A0A078L5Q3_9GAMM|nr:DNA polymerase III subunit delta' [Legionella massiliensis]CDZ79273.1 DNA polymerase III subunit gamma/tau [Legionella massiliensis]CEE15011.1 DNA polymerase III subunit delta' [Legionella massiliensis]
MKSPEASPLYEQLWQRFQTIHANQRLHHALLLVGPESVGLISLAYAMASTILCNEQQKPCGACKSCRLTNTREHPDVNCIEPDKTGSANLIKIDQIRDLQSLVFRSPQLGDKRIIILYPAEKMNIAAANALLKLLEEPPEGVHFLLIAEQLSTIPATIISRCQQWRFVSANIDNDYLALAENSSADSARGELFTQLPQIISGLTELVSNKTTIFSLANKWLDYEFSALIWLLYLLNSQLIDYKLRGQVCKQQWTEQLSDLAKYFQPVHLFKQLDQINEISKKLQQNINLNKQLVLENLLLGYSLCL